MFSWLWLHGFGLQDCHASMGQFISFGSASFGDDVC